MLRVFAEGGPTFFLRHIALRASVEPTQQSSLGAACGSDSHMSRVWKCARESGHNKCIGNAAKKRDRTKAACPRLKMRCRVIRRNRARASRFYRGDLVLSRRASRVRLSYLARCSCGKYRGIASPGIPHGSKISNENYGRFSTYTWDMLRITS